MAPAPESYTPEYCEAVRQGCQQQMVGMASKVDDVHGAVFGSPEQPGLMTLLTKKVSTSSVKWIFSMIGIPLILGALSFYAFYVKAPLLYGERETVLKHETRIIDVEKDVRSLQEAVSQLPTGAQIKDIMKEALNEHGK